MRLEAFDSPRSTLCDVALYGLDDGPVGGEPLHASPPPRWEPSQFIVVLERLRLTFHHTSKPQVHHQAWRERPVATHSVPDLNRNPELFADLAMERRFFGFTEFDLPTWKLPAAR